MSLLLVVALLGSAFVGSADARTHHYTKAQKRAISKKLLRQLKKNPRLINKRWFVKKATLVSFTLPATIRINPVDAPVSFGGTGKYVPNGAGDSTATLDLGPSLGARTIGLGGTIKANINFNDAFDGGTLGEVRVSIPAQSGINNTTGVPTGITSTSVPLLTTTGTGTQCSSPGSFGTLSAVPGHSGADDAPGQDLASLMSTSYLPDNQNDSLAPDNLESNVGQGPFSPNAGGTDTEQDVTLRTANLALGVPGADQDLDLNTGVGNNTPTGSSGGYANLFGLGVQGTPHSALLGVTLTTAINSIVRASNPDIPGGLPAVFNCRQAWTGYIKNTLRAYLEGDITINPGLTADGRLRIATVNLNTPSGKETKARLAACLVPFAPFTNALGGDASTVATPPSPAAGVILGYHAAGADPSSNNECNSKGPLSAAGFVQQVKNDSGGIDTFTNYDDVVDPVTGEGKTGAAVAISGDLKVNNLYGEVLIGP